MSSSSSSSGPGFPWGDANVKLFVTDAYNGTKFSVTLPGLRSTGASLSAGALKDQYKSDLGEDMPESTVTAIKNSIESMTMSLLSNALDTKMNNAIQGSWPGYTINYPSGVRDLGTSASLSVGPMNFTTGGDMTAKWQSVISDILNNRLSLENTFNNITVGFSIGNNLWKVQLGGTYSGVLTAPSAHRDHEWKFVGSLTYFW